MNERKPDTDYERTKKAADLCDKFYKQALKLAKEGKLALINIDTGKLEIAQKGVVLDSQPGDFD